MILSQIAGGGTSIWLDDLSRASLTGNSAQSLAKRIAESGVVGVTTNPAIFHAAITGSGDYKEAISQMRGAGVDEVVRTLTTDDVRNACDLFSPIFHSSNGVDGRVSIEVDPRLANNTNGTVTDGLKLWKLVDRPNLMIKVPATDAGLPAISELIAAGISVNVTLIFSRKRYAEVIAAFMTGLEMRKALSADLTKIHSVASFFVSRIDSSIDARLKEIATPAASALLGKAAIANAQLAYQLYENTQSSPRWRALSEAGANMQRPLWASTGVKDPAYSDTRYVIELIAKNVVNTMPPKTLDAVIDHGNFAGDTITPNYQSAKATLQALAEIGISLDEVTGLLEDDGINKFIGSWLALLDDVEKVLTQ